MNEASRCQVVFGGAFDPIHFGHIRPLMELKDKIPDSTIYLLPCNRHPDKQVVASTTHRLDMLRFVESPPHIFIDEREIHQLQVCYTVDTLTHIRQEIGIHMPLAFVLGQDAFKHIESWKQYTHILDLAHLIVLTRPGWDQHSLETHAVFQHCGGWSDLSQIYNEAAGKLFNLHNETTDVSSSHIQQLIAAGKEPRYLLPGNIWRYIQEQQLYQVRAT